MLSGSSTQPRLCGEAVRPAVEVVHRVAAVEVGDPVHRVGVLAAVRVGALHDLERELLVDREGAVHGRRGRDAGVGRGGQDLPAVVPDGQGLRLVLAGQRVGVAVAGLSVPGRHVLEHVGPDRRARLAVHGQAVLVLEGPDRAGQDHVARPLRPEAVQLGRVAALPAEAARRRLVGGRDLGRGVGPGHRGAARGPGQRQVPELGQQLLEPGGRVGGGGEAAGELGREVTTRVLLGPVRRAHAGRAVGDGQRDRGVLGEALPRG